MGSDISAMEGARFIPSEDARRWLPGLPVTYVVLDRYRSTGFPGRVPSWPGGVGRWRSEGVSRWRFSANLASSDMAIWWS